LEAVKYFSVATCDKQAGGIILEKTIFANVSRCLLGRLIPVASTEWVLGERGVSTAVLYE